ncbi:hypothetical protein ACA910_001669 [Epithemia clementina (nom. ined.)]
MTNLKRRERILLLLLSFILAVVKSLAAQITTQRLAQQQDPQQQERVQRRVVERIAAIAVDYTVNAQELINTRHNAPFPVKTANSKLLGSSSGDKITRGGNISAGDSLAIQSILSQCRPAENGYFGSTSRTTTADDEKSNDRKVETDLSTTFAYSFELETAFPSNSSSQQREQKLNTIVQKIRDIVMDAVLAQTFPSQCWFDDELGNDSTTSDSNKFPMLTEPLLPTIDNRSYTVTGFWFDLVSKQKEVDEKETNGSCRSTSVGSDKGETARFATSCQVYSSIIKVFGESTDQSIADISEVISQALQYSFYRLLEPMGEVIRIEPSGSFVEIIEPNGVDGNRTNDSGSMANGNNNNGVLSSTDNEQQDDNTTLLLLIGLAVFMLISLIGGLFLLFSFLLLREKRKKRRKQKLLQHGDTPSFDDSYYYQKQPCLGRVEESATSVSSFKRQGEHGIDVALLDPSLGSIASNQLPHTQPSTASRDCNSSFPPTFARTIMPSPQTNSGTNSKNHPIINSENTFMPSSDFGESSNPHMQFLLAAAARRQEPIPVTCRAGPSTSLPVALPSQKLHHVFIEVASDFEETDSDASQPDCMSSVALEDYFERGIILDG